MRELHLKEVGDAWAEARTADAWNAAVAEAGFPVIVSSAFRTRGEQAMLHQGWLLHHDGYHRAAAPGHSTHERGLSVDAAFRSASEREAFALIAARHGLVRDVADEPWHFTFKPEGT